MTDDEKLYSDLTPEEKEELLQQVRDQIGAERFDKISKVAQFLQDSEAAAGIGEFLALFMEEIKDDPILADTPTEQLPGKLKGIEEAALRAIERIQTQEKAQQTEIAKVGGRRIKSLDFPLDKLNANIWKLLEKDTGGQIAIGTEKHDSKVQLNILYSINFEELGNGIKITKRLEVFDKRVYIAIAALFNAGNAYISMQQVYNAMGYDGRPGTSDIRKISESISKMAAAHIFIDNTQEAQAYNYPEIRYDASLLPMERARVILNGQEVEAIHLFREPPVVSFARGRKQLTQIERRLLASPLNKTNQNMELEDYLIERIAHAKRGTLSAKIKYDTIFEQTNMNGKQRQRAPEKIAKLLDHYVKCAWIKSYQMEKDGVRIAW